MGLYDAEYALFQLGPTAPGELDQVVSALQRGEFGVIDNQGQFVLARRGASAAQNVEVLTKMGYPPRPAQPVKQELVAPKGAIPEKPLPKRKP